MKRKNNSKNCKNGCDEPVLTFITGNVHYPTSKRLTRNIYSAKTLWLLAKMVGCIKKNNENKDVRITAE